MEASTLSKSQVIEIASKYIISHGLEDFDVETAFNEGYWLVWVFFSKGPDGAEYPNFSKSMTTLELSTTLPT